jgi:hypothetical protein
VSKENKVCQPAANRIAGETEMMEHPSLANSIRRCRSYFPPDERHNKKRKFRDPWNPTAAAAASHVDCVGRTQPVANFRQTH